MKVTNLQEYKNRLADEDKKFQKDRVTHEETQLILSSILEHSENRITVDEAMKVMKWAEETRLGNSILEAVLKKEILILINEEGEICFKTAE